MSKVSEKLISLMPSKQTSLSLAIHTAQNLPSIPPEYKTNQETWLIYVPIVHIAKKLDACFEETGCSRAQSKSASIAKNSNKLLWSLQELEPLNDQFVRAMQRIDLRVDIRQISWFA